MSSAAAHLADAPAALCIDLDGTLIHSDLLLESMLLLIKRNPLYLFCLPFWLLKGKAGLKAEIAKRVALNPAALPYNTEFLQWATEQKAAGRSLWLCTASNHRLADAVAAHCALFDGVVASSDTLNMSGSNKARQLAAQFGARRFDYCGNHKIDLQVWRLSKGAVVVNGSAGLQRKAARQTAVLASFPGRQRRLRATIKALRPHQWVKNVLLFIPMAAAHILTSPGALVAGLLAFLSFGLAASSVYLLNDMLDLEADRAHPKKRFRPFAAGDVSLLVGMALTPLLLLASLALTLLLPVEFRLVLIGYYVMTLAYSFGLKRIVMVDTMVLAGLYTIRIVAGASAVDVPLSFWLLLFSIFLFLSLALVKRYAELDGNKRRGKLSAAGRGYLVEDLSLLYSMGVAAGFLCVLVLALYINSPEVTLLYRHPRMIWPLCLLLLYWISRVWMVTHRGDMHDDPVVFALKDPISILVGALCAATVLSAV
ncbi:UbiA family prenyltransferase [Duganella aceris]|uniref:UbiA family prenyltransferase n=1 Tax=Duganella aceris TaxID=2703883 RepID=A0ABX0FUJ8_9BURK|nr:UbiA family prenyltransferase [Duganella aceris]NGZ88050.1 UbiA family prenyltransferase [Duganella aceris]